MLTRIIPTPPPNGGYLIGDDPAQMDFSQSLGPGASAFTETRLEPALRRKSDTTTIRRAGIYIMCLLVQAMLQGCVAGSGPSQTLPSRLAAPSPTMPANTTEEATRSSPVPPTARFTATQDVPVLTVSATSTALPRTTAARAPAGKQVVAQGTVILCTQPDQRGVPEALFDLDLGAAGTWLAAQRIYEQYPELLDAVRRALGK